MSWIFLLRDFLMLVFLSAVWKHTYNAPSNVRWQGSRLSCLRIYANASQKRVCGNLLRLLNGHFVHEEERLLAHLLKPGANRDQISRQQLALILDALVYSHHPDALFAQALARQSGRSQQVPGRFIEFSYVPLDVHVAHVIAMPGINRAAVSNSRVSHDVSSLANPSNGVARMRGFIEAHSRINRTRQGFECGVPILSKPEVIETHFHVCRK